MWSLALPGAGYQAHLCSFIRLYLADGRSLNSLNYNELQSFGSTMVYLLQSVKKVLNILLSQGEVSDAIIILL